MRNLFHVLTLFPEMVLQGLSPSVIGRACEKNIITLNAVNIRDYTKDRHGKVDDYPYGGGAGMLMQAQPVFDAHRAVTGGRNIRTIYVTPQGSPFTQQMARELAEETELVFLCGHYEGIDERVLEEIVTDFVSIGDYVLTGGELPAMVMIDAIARLIPGVLGNDGSAEEESFYRDLLEYPQYSRPEEWHGRKVPAVLLSGDHRKVAKWRLEEAKRRTARRRPDLYEKYQQKQLLIRLLSRQKRNHIHIMESLDRGNGEIVYSHNGEGTLSVLVYDRNSRTSMAIAADCSFGEKIADCLPGEGRFIVISDLFLKDILAKRHYRVLGEYAQMLYTKKEVLRVKHRDIRCLTMEHFPQVCRLYCPEGGPGIEEGYLRERILAGAMYGAFLEGNLAGFVGVHSEGSLGMLYVEEPFRGQGIALSLESYVVNRMLERGQTPYCHVSAENTESGRLQERLGFYKAEKTFWWLEKVLAK